MGAVDRWCSTVCKGGEAGARLERELVERKMACAETKRPVQFRPPFRLRLAGAGIDQVKAHPVERGLRDIQRLQPFGDIMRPAKEAQRLIVQRLKAQRSAEIGRAP